MGYLNKKDRGRLAIFFTKCERHLWGVRAGERIAKMYAHDHGIGDIAQNHSLTRLAKHYCKFWRVLDDGRFRQSRNHSLSASQWKMLMNFIQMVMESSDGTETLAYLYRRVSAGFQLRVSKQCVKEGARVAGYILKEKP